MGLIGSKCKSKVDWNDVGENVRYKRLNDVQDDNCAKNEEKNRKQSKNIALRNDNSSWDAIYTGVKHTGECKHSKSLSLTTQVSPKSPKSTATTDGDDVQSVSTLTSMLENPLLKRVKPDNPLYKRADGELRPVGPVHPWKLGKDKNQIRLELEEKGLIKSKSPQEEIIGNLRNVGIIRHDALNDSTLVTNELIRRLPARLTHLPVDAIKAQTTISDEKLACKGKLNSNVVLSKSESATESTSILLGEKKGKEDNESSAEVSSGEKGQNMATFSQSKEKDEKKETDLIELKIKILEAEML